jgi:L-serine/L-threonine ammonia-lyase
MTIKAFNVEQEAPQNPWVETPLRESYALSEAAGWYGDTALFITIFDS